MFSTSYTARYSHAIIALALGVLLLMGGEQWPLWRWIFRAAGGVSWLMIVVIWVVIMLDTRPRYYEAMATYADAIAKLPEDRLDVLKLAHPVSAQKWRGRSLVQTFENTDATMNDLYKFLTESDQDHTPSERYWGNRTAYNQILNWFIANRYIIPNSATSNHSWMWYPEMYALARTRYMAIPNLSPSPSVLMPPNDPRKDIYHTETRSTRLTQKE